MVSSAALVADMPLNDEDFYQDREDSRCRAASDAIHVGSSGRDRTDRVFWPCAPFVRVDLMTALREE
jgi:hypothetical protein